MRTRLLLAVGICALAGWVGLAATGRAADVTLADNGKSDYVIIVPVKSPTSLKDAAEELQKDIALASGPTLAIQPDSSSATAHFISLGATRQATAAGFSSEQMPVEGYRIVTKGGNLYILGPDTPNGGWTSNNGTSTGTANGVYTFLEDEMNVRWLMPGDLGRVVPKQETLRIKEMDRQGEPLFHFRKVTHYRDYTATEEQQRTVELWLAHLRVGVKNSSVDFHVDANWWQTINGAASPDPLHPIGQSYYSAAVKALHQKHPEWFAMNAQGQRPLPNSAYDKLETTNQDLVKWYAKEAIRVLKASKRPIRYSLSPTDGSHWSQSPQSKALYDPPPHTSAENEMTKAGAPSMTSLVLTWYDQIARIVEKEYPQGRLSGYIYAEYLYPPVKAKMSLPKNLTPEIAVSINYGYSLYRPGTQKEFKYLMDAWAKVIPGAWYYYDLPDQMHRQVGREVGAANFPGSTGIVTPASTEILNCIFSTLVKSHIDGGYFYATDSMSSGSLANYMLFKLMWNPKLNASDLRRQWLDLAYGGAAGEIMERFYEKLDDWYKSYYISHPSMRYELSLDMLRDLYAVHYPELEKLYLAAKSQTMTEVQKERLQLIGDNLIVLQWRLRNGGLWPANQASELQRSDAEVVPMLTQVVSGFKLFPGIMRDVIILAPGNKASGRQVAAALKGVKIQAAAGQAPSNAGKPPTFDSNIFLIYPTKDQTIRIMPSLVNPDAYFATYAIATAYDAFFELELPMMQTGVLENGKAFEFHAKANTPYYLYLPPRRTVSYKLTIQGAATAGAGLANKTLTLYGPADAPIYVYHHAGRSGSPELLAGEGLVTIEKLAGRAGIQSHIMRDSQYRDVKVLATLNDGWRISPDPKDQLQSQGVTGMNFDDNSWKTISATNWWQHQGGPELADYHGSVWYRKAFNAPALTPGQVALVYFGSVDGIADAYLNGKKIGQHRLGENYAGWNKPFFFQVNDLQDGRNVLAVKVTDKDTTGAGGAAGITGGVTVLEGTPMK